MKRLSRSVRPSFARLRSIMGLDKPRRHRAGRLAEAAGAGPLVEQLESRQLLFALTITPDLVNPVTGVGTVRAFFGYTVPHLTTTAVAQTNPIDVRTDDLSDDARGNVASGRVLAGSNIRIEHTISPPTSLQITGVTSPTGQPQTDTNFLFVRMNTSQRLGFRAAVGQLNGAMRAFSVAIGSVNGSQGIDLDAFRVELRFQGEVISAFEGATGAGSLGETNQTNPGLGIGTFIFASTDVNNPVFDEVVFIALSGPNPEFGMDDFQANVQPGNNVDLVTSRIFGAELVFTGPLGARIELFDLYNRPMQQTIALGTPQGASNIAIVDPDDNGIPNFNDGIGRIVMTGTDGVSGLTIVGGTISNNQNQQNAEFFQGGFAFLLPAGPAGIYDLLETGGYGYAVDPTDGSPVGLSPAGGSVIIGSPYTRPQNGYNPGGLPPSGTDFNFVRANQGVFVTDGSNFGSVYIHGVLHGSSRFNGYLQSMFVSTMLGSANIKGDLGRFTVGGDAGVWEVDSDFTTPAGLTESTGGQLVVERTLGEVLVGGRMQMNVTVLGDLNSPVIRPARDVFNYYERERAYEFDPGTQDGPRVTLRALVNNNNWLSRVELARNFGAPIPGQAPIHAGSFIRNDRILSAEWVGSVGTGARIYGDVGGADPINTAGDPVDLFAFASDGVQQITIELDSGARAGLGGGFFPGVYARIVDAQGRTLAATAGDNRAGSIGAPGTAFSIRGQRLAYQPTAPGVYYLAISSPPVNNDGAVDAVYSATIVGMAATTLGAVRAGAQLGGAGPALDNTIGVQSGSVGSIRGGTGVVIGTGAEVDPIAAYNDDDADADSRFQIRTVTVSVPGTLYNITAGGDIEGGGLLTAARFNIGGDLGSLVTGLSPVVGVGPNEGDIGNLILQVGRRIGILDIKGAIAVDQDANDPDLGVIGPVSIRTGTNGGSGDIGMIRVGEHVRAGLLDIDLAPGSVIGAFLVGQDVPNEIGGNGYNGIYLGNGLFSNTGLGSDIRFVDIPNIDLTNTINAGFAIVGGQVLEFIDDGGGTIRIEITNLAAGVQGGFVTVLPVDGSEGVAVARIDADLTGGRALVLTSVGNGGDTLSIGHINLTGADAGSAIRFLGPAQIDTWRITQTGGSAFLEIVNQTPGGDIVAIDVAGLTRVSIAGNLGSTETPGWGPHSLAPFQGLQNGAVNAVYGPLGMTGVFNTQWSGQIFRPVQNTVVDPGTAFLDDIGGPFDPYLNGIVVRGGNLTDVLVGGSIGDVIVQNGSVNQVVANSDFNTPQGGFHGIVGNIYASGDIVVVRVGDGIARSAGGPIPTVGIFAGDDIISVTGPLQPRPAIITGTIAASNIDGLFTPQDGIVGLTLAGGGDIIDAYISSEQLDAYWTGFLPYAFEDAPVQLGVVHTVSGTGADFIRSQIHGAGAESVVFSGGVWDASLLQVTGGIGAIQADRFRNSTLQGADIEFRPNAIIGGLDLGSITAGLAGAGDISDLRVDVVGNVTGSILARNISRTRVDVDNVITLVTATGDIRASRFIAGELRGLTAALNIYGSFFSISGAIVSLTAGDAIRNTAVRVTGPDGRIDLISARTLFSGSITASGPVATVTVTEGDIAGVLTTTTTRGNVGTLAAGRDVDLTTDISGTLGALNAGRHIGDIDRRRTILVRGDLVSLNAPNGQLYSDVRIGQALTGTAVIGAPTHLPTGSDLGRGDITAFGPIATVRVLGDFGGRITSHSGGITLVSINDGSLLPGASISAYDGNIQNVVINRGHLLGDIHADHILFAVNVNASADGVFGDIGVNPDLNPNVPVPGDPRRNQLPPGVIANTPIQGPRITAGHNIGRITTSNGGVFEAFIYAGRAMGTLTFNGDVRNDPMTAGTGTVIASGSTMFRVAISGSLFDSAILAGVTGFGSDGRPGGVGVARDTNHSGRIGTITVGGAAANTYISAGITTGQDGLYNNTDDLVTPGLSFVRNVLVSGAVDPATVSVFSEFPMSAVTPGIVTGGLSLHLQDTDIYPGGPPPGGTELPGGGAAFGFTTAAGEAGTLRFTGPGRAFWDPANNRVVLLNTKATSSLLVSAANGALTDFDIVSNDEASVGTISIAANLLGDSDVIVDNHIVNFQANNIAGSGELTVGGNFRNFTTGNMSGGQINARFVRTLTIVGSFGLTTESDEATARFLAAGDLFIGGTDAAAILVDRDVFSLSVGGAMSRGIFRSGSDVGPVTLGGLSESRISVRDNIGAFTVNGSVFDTSIMAGGDLGADGRPGGTGFDADAATTGAIASVTIAGNFVESDIIAGLLRGADGFFGTDDDSAAAGRSTIGAVTIGGAVFGSNVFTEQYRIMATGSVGAVTAGGVPVTSAGNFRAGEFETDPLAIQINDLRVGQVGLIFSAQIYFNQAMDASTIAPALSVFEVRNSGNQLIRLTFGADYTVEYDADLDIASVTFSRDITDRNLPLTNQPGPGVYRFVFDDAVLRAAVADARLDGNGNGSVGPGSDDYSFDSVVGDAGDKLVNNTVFTVGEPRVDFRAPIDLDVVLDDNFTPDGLPEINAHYTVRGSIGDHPDHNPVNFGFGADTDVYKITLQAGQILRMGAMAGNAAFAVRGLYNANGAALGGAASDALSLPVFTFFPEDIGSIDTIADDYLIKKTGTYYIVLGTGDFTNPDGLSTAGIEPGEFGDYNFNITVFDDGDSGFGGDTNAGNGAALATPPMPIAFAGPDQQFDTSDDLAAVVVGDFTFTLNRGPDGTPNTTDDVVAGGNGAGVVTQRTNLTRITTRVDTAIGDPGHVGIPGDSVSSDVDVFHLNQGLAIAPGTRFTVTIKLAEFGADLGSRTQDGLFDWNPDVQFGLFETTGVNDLGSARLVFSPSDFRSSGGATGTIAQSGPVSYGYNAAGDFFITFVTPGRLGVANATPASYAVYVQGVFNTDYAIEIVQQGTASFTRTKQNFFIETHGGTIDWLDATGATIALNTFQASALGFTGVISGQSAQAYILSNLVANLTAMFDAAGVDAVFSTNPSQFEFEDFSTIFLSTTNDPLHFFSERNYGVSEHSDPFNTDHNDEAAVFVPSFATLGFTPSQDDVNNFVDSLSAAVGRRAAELLGLRFTEDQFGLGGDPTAANSPELFGQSFSFTSASRSLSSLFDTDAESNFFLGQQSAVPLLNKIVRP